MSRRERDAVKLALDDLAILPTMLRVAYGAVLTPRAARNDAGVRSPGVRHVEPTPGDPEGWDTYRWACDELVGVLTRLAPGFHLPAHVADSWPPAPGRAALLVAAVRAYVAVADVRSSTRLRACARLAQVRVHLRHVTGTVTPPRPPRCDTPGCTEMQQHGRRCYRCKKHRDRHGSYPEKLRSFG